MTWERMLLQHFENNKLIVIESALFKKARKSVVSPRKNFCQKQFEGYGVEIALGLYASVILDSSMWNTFLIMLVIAVFYFFLMPLLFEEGGVIFERMYLINKRSLKFLLPFYKEA